MTEKEAWLTLAKWFKDDPLQNSFVYLPNGKKAFGLCICIFYLFPENDVKNDPLYDTMMQKIERHLPLGHHYLFPLDSDGPRKRREFCLERAKELQ